ncbi:MAG TPA: hypothetical protein VHP99_10060 [Pyrinomonadaceae bacterium]|jgi:hypothetical protein|nr:hypothetical protein [Pyrinomonadaceae bacterium]
MSGKLCRDVRQEIDQADLRQALSASSEAHVGSCTACAAFRDERFRLRELVGGLQPVTAPADFDIRLRARIARERDVPKQPFIFRLVMSTPAIVVAAVLVIAVGATVFVSQRNSSQDAALASDKGKEVKSTPAPIEIAQDHNPEPGPSSPPVNDKTLKPKQSNFTARNTAKPASPANALPEVSDSAVRSAQSVKMTDRDGQVTLTAPLRPMIVTVYDEHGGTRRIQLPPISFGSQRFTDNRSQVSMTNTKDW